MGPNPRKNEVLLFVRDYAFIPFDKWEEAEQFQKEHNVVFCKCGNCFPDEGNK